MQALPLTMIQPLVMHTQVHVTKSGVDVSGWSTEQADSPVHKAVPEAVPLCSYQRGLCADASFSLAFPIPPLFTLNALTSRATSGHPSGAACPQPPPRG